MSDSRPIGIFDSGLGGLSVLKEVRRQLPAESTLYFADQGRLPYGPRPLAQVRQFSEQITRFLLAHSAKVIVVACNTASAAALAHLRQTFPGVPFVGMEPAVKPAAEQTKNRVVGVIATQATAQSALFAGVVDRFANGVTVLTRACPGLVTQVEAGELDSPRTYALLRQYLDPLVAGGIDSLVLACTHFSFLTPAIADMLGPQVTIIDPAPAVARQVGRLTAGAQGQPGGDAPTTNGWTSPTAIAAYTTATPPGDSALASRLVGEPITFQSVPLVKLEKF
ncbi:MAG: glutamate racemase [Chloroflexi bacterium]|nr:glutamate racemase [Chloroflexota bacterium]MBI5828213.1 glutamate racemase [Chloroflexota bacterium]